MTFYKNNTIFYLYSSCIQLPENTTIKEQSSVSGMFITKIELRRTSFNAMFWNRMTNCFPRLILFWFISNIYLYFIVHSLWWFITGLASITGYCYFRIIWFGCFFVLHKIYFISWSAASSSDSPFLLFRSEMLSRAWLRIWRRMFRIWLPLVIMVRHHINCKLVKLIHGLTVELINEHPQIKILVYYCPTIYIGQRLLSFFVIFSVSKFYFSNHVCISSVVVILFRNQRGRL